VSLLNISIIKSILVNYIVSMDQEPYQGRDSNISPAQSSVDGFVSKESVQSVSASRSKKPLIVGLVIALLLVGGIGAGAYFALDLGRGGEKLPLEQALATALEKMSQADISAQTVVFSLNGVAKDQNGVTATVGIEATAEMLTELAENIKDLKSQGLYDINIDLDIDDTKQVATGSMVIDGDFGLEYRLVDEKVFYKLSEVNLAITPPSFISAMASGMIGGVTGVLKDQWVYVSLADIADSDPDLRALLSRENSLSIEDILKDVNFNSIVSKVEALPDREINGVDSYGYQAHLDWDGLINEIFVFFENPENRKIVGMSENEYRSMVARREIFSQEVGQSLTNAFPKEPVVEIWFEEGAHKLGEVRVVVDIDYDDEQGAGGFVGVASFVVAYLNDSEAVVITAPTNARSFEEFTKEMGGMVPPGSVFGWSSQSNQE